MKILRVMAFFYPAFGFGGPVNHSFRLSKMQAQAGHDVSVFTTNILTHSQTGQNLASYENISGVKIRRFSIPKMFLTKAHYLITPQMIPALLTSDADIFHVHSYKTFQYDAISLAKLIKNKPFIFTSHGTMIDLAASGIIQSQPKSRQAITKTYDHYLKYLNVNLPDFIIVHSLYEKNLSLNYGVKKHKLRVIPHGVNIDRFQGKDHLALDFRRKYGLTEKNQILLHVGRILSNYRNQDQLITIFPKILKKYPNARLLLVGENFDKQYQLELEKLVKSLNLTKEVIFEYQPSQDLITGGYLACNMFVFPTRFRETFGIPICEAGAAKKPCIAPRICAMPELIVEKKTGLLYELDNTEEMFENIMYLLDNPEKARIMGENAYQRIRNNYTFKHIFKKNEEVLEEAKNLL